MCLYHMFNGERYYIQNNNCVIQILEQKFHSSQTIYNLQQLLKEHVEMSDVFTSVWVNIIFNIIAICMM